MAIISANRFGTLNGNYVVAANESYGVEDIGRILYESEVNDQKIFNSALMNDMRELKARTEGTLLESELQMFSENSAKEFGKAIIEKLKKFWAKIKGVFKKAYAMLSAWVVRNGKAFVAMHRKDIANIKDGTKVNKVFLRTEDLGNLFDMNAITKDMNQEMNLNAENDISAADLAKKYINDAAPEGFSLGDGSLYEAIKDFAFEEVSELNRSDVYKMIADLENGRKPITALHKLERDTDKQIRECINSIEKTSKESIKSTDKEDEKSTAKTNLKKMQNAASGMESAVGTIVRSSIRAIKFNLGQCRSGLAKAISVKMESYLAESMILEGDDEIESMEDDVASDSPEVTAAAEELVDAVIAAIDDAENDEDDDDSYDEE